MLHPVIARRARELRIEPVRIVRLGVRDRVDEADLDPVLGEADELLGPPREADAAAVGPQLEAISTTG